MFSTTPATHNTPIGHSSADGLTEFQRAAQWSGARWLSDLQCHTLDWLWPNRIPLGRVTLLVGDPGLGKSLLTLDIAARVSRGAPWPDSEPNPQSEIRDPKSIVNPQPSSVLLLTAEDDVRDTVLPRLAALGADPSKIAVVPAVHSHQFRTATVHVPDGDHKLPPMIRTVDLHQDLSRINTLLHSMPDCRLIIVDPISAYLGNANEQSTVRGLLFQLAALAQHHNVALLAVSHLRKKEGAAIHRAMGSLAFVAAARAAWVLSKDQEQPNRRLFLPLKNNLAPDSSGLAFDIESHPTSNQPILCWSPEPIDTAAECVIGNLRSKGRPDAERQDAIEWLLSRLAPGPAPAKQVHEEADAHGIAMRTLRRAFRQISGQAIRENSSPSAPWMWMLPTADRPTSHTDGQKSGEELWPSVNGPEDCAPRTSPT